MKGVVTSDPAVIKKATDESREAYLAMAYLCGLSKERYQELLDDLSNDYLAGRDE